MTFLERNILHRCTRFMGRKIIWCVLKTMMLNNDEYLISYDEEEEEDIDIEDEEDLRVKLE